MHTKIEFTDSVTVLYSPLYENGGFADYAKKLRFDGGKIGSIFYGVAQGRSIQYRLEHKEPEELLRSFHDLLKTIEGDNTRCLSAGVFNPNNPSSARADSLHPLDEAHYIDAQSHLLIADIDGLTVNDCPFDPRIDPENALRFAVDLIPDLYGLAVVSQFSGSFGVRTVEADDYGHPYDALTPVTRNDDGTFDFLLKCHLGIALSHACTLEERRKIIDAINERSRNVGLNTKGDNVLDTAVYSSKNLIFTSPAILERGLCRDIAEENRTVFVDADPIDGTLVLDVNVMDKANAVPERRFGKSDGNYRHISGHLNPAQLGDSATTEFNKRVFFMVLRCLSLNLEALDDPNFVASFTAELKATIGQAPLSFDVQERRMREADKAKSTVKNAIKHIKKNGPSLGWQSPDEPEFENQEEETPFAFGGDFRSKSRDKIEAIRAERMEAVG